MQKLNLINKDHISESINIFQNIYVNRYMFVPKDKIQSNIQNKFFFSKNANFENIISENNFLLLLKILKSFETFVLKYHIIPKHQKYLK